MSSDGAEILWDLFVHRRDTYATQGIHGQYVRVEKPLDREALDAHLRGETTIGAYQFSTASTCTWICFDFDGDNLDDQLQYAKLLYLKLRDEEHIPSVALEFSGKKGYHVWVFVNEIDGTSAKIWAEEISKDYGVHEIFPKQMTVSGDKFGNLVKIPLAVHRVSGKRSVIYNENCQALKFEEGLAFLRQLRDAPRHTLPRVVVKEIIRTITVPRGKTDPPPFIQDTIASGVKEGERHKYRFIITKELYHAGYADAEIKAELLRFNNNCTPPDMERVVTTHAEKLLQYPERYLTKEQTIDLVTPADLAAVRDINYTTVRDTYRKWFYMEDDTIIDLCLAVAIARQEPTPLWFILIAPSGSGKSELLRPIEDHNNPSTTEVMSRITKNTFLSGVKDEPDFAETLRNTPKLFLTYDFAQFVKLNSEEKAQIWAQLRDLYDGFLERKAAFNVRKKVDQIKINWLICSTPVVDSELLIQQELGTRELLYRFKHEKLDETQLMDQIWRNIDRIKELRAELSTIVRRFIEKKEAEGLKDIDVPIETRERLMKTALMISCLRAATESDRFTGELENFVYKEMPTRILAQLRTLYKALKNLDDAYDDERALQVITRVALSSIHPIRLRILIELMEHSDLSTTDIQKRLSIGWKTVNTQLYTARQLGLVEFREDQYEHEEGKRDWSRKYWYLRDHPVVHFLRELSDVKETLDVLYPKAPKPSVAVAVVNEQGWVDDR